MRVSGLCVAARAATRTLATSTRLGALTVRGVVKTTPVVAFLIVVAILALGVRTTHHSGIH